MKKLFYNKELREAIDYNNYTMESLNKELGFKKKYIDKIVRFEEKPTAEAMSKIAKCLNLSNNEIFPEEYDSLYDNMFKEMNKISIVSLPFYEDLFKKEFECSCSVIRDTMRKCLTVREYCITSLYFRIDSEDAMTYEEIANLVGVRRERIRQIIAKSLEKVRCFEKGHYVEIALHSLITDQ